MSNDFTPVTVDDRPVLNEAVVLRRLIGPPDTIEGKVTAVGPDVIAVEFPDQTTGRPRIAVVHRRDEGVFQSLDRYTLGRAGPSELDRAKALLRRIERFMSGVPTDAQLDAKLVNGDTGREIWSAMRAFGEGR